MLGLPGWEGGQKYALQTLVDNVSQLSPKVLIDINQVVVEAGHALLKKSPRQPLPALLYLLHPCSRPSP